MKKNNKSNTKKQKESKSHIKLNHDIDQLLDLITDGDEKEAAKMIMDCRSMEINRPLIKKIEHKKDKDGVTALMAALLHNRDEIVKLLIHDSNICALDNDNTSVLGYACLSDNVEYVYLLDLMLSLKKKQNMFFIKNKKNHRPLDYLLAYIKNKKTK